MKILFVTDGIHPLVIGGMQKHSTMLLKYLSRMDIDITLIHSGNRSGTDLSLQDIFTNGERSNIEFIEIPFVDQSKLPGHYVRANKRFSLQCYESVKDRMQEFDVVYAKGFTAYSFLKNKSSFDASVCCKLHGYEMYVDIPGLIRKVQQTYLRKIAGYITTQSDFAFSYGGKITDLIKDVGVPEERILICPGGIEASWLLEDIKPVGTVRKFMFVGRFERRKGIQELQASIEILEAQKMNFECHFVGPIPKEVQLKSEQCIYHGLIKDPEKIRAIYDECDILVCPSYAEGMPNVIFEAMSRGVAIIGTNVGAVADQVTNNGWLIEAGSVKELNNAMNEALSNSSDQLSEMKRNSLKLIRDKFTWEKVSERFVDLLKEQVLKS